MGGGEELNNPTQQLRLLPSMTTIQNVCIFETPKNIVP